MKAFGLFGIFLLLAGFLFGNEMGNWQIPMGGNAYLTTEVPGAPDGVRKDIGTQWENPGSVFSVYFRVDKPADLKLSLRLRVPEGKSVIRATVAGWKNEITAEGAEPKDYPAGKVRVKAPGYVRVDLQGVQKTGKVFAEVTDLLVSSPTADLQPTFVKNNDGNSFYWGRRGPSIHLYYGMPEKTQIEYAYTEVTVPPGQDPIGSYFMANGFGEGYFGMQVRNGNERWILFSVWSPTRTDHPGEIPEDEKIHALKQGQDVTVREFGGEGSGGQSFWVYQWKAGVTYRFLNSAKPDGQGNTIYSAWFGEVGKPGWKLIASFKRPKITTHLWGYHSFLENFNDTKGYLGRGALYGNQWVCDISGKWHEVTEATFTGDGTARSVRTDRAAGLLGKGFFMRNGGFFADTMKLDQTFHRPSTPRQEPKIDFSKLDRL